MPDFTVVMMVPEYPGRAISVIVEAEDPARAANAAAAQIVLIARRAGEIIRPEELVPAAVFHGRHVDAYPAVR